MITKHEQKSCPRCKSTFECKVGSIDLCQCSAVYLKEEEREYISTHYEDCLCARCMIQMKEEYLAKSEKV